MSHKLLNIGCATVCAAVCAHALLFSASPSLHAQDDQEVVLSIEIDTEMHLRSVRSRPLRSSLQL